jgi:hypothetical protein
VLALEVQGERVNCYLLILAAQKRVNNEAHRGSIVAWEEAIATDPVTYYNPDGSIAVYVFSVIGPQGNDVGFITVSAYKHPVVLEFSTALAPHKIVRDDDCKANPKVDAEHLIFLGPVLYVYSIMNAQESTFVSLDSTLTLHPSKDELAQIVQAWQRFVENWDSQTTEISPAQIQTSKSIDVAPVRQNCSTIQPCSCATCGGQCACGSGKCSCTDKCWVGCTPAAGASILKYWNDHGYNGLGSDANPIMVSLHQHMNTDQCGATTRPNATAGVETYTASKGYNFDAYCTSTHTGCNGQWPTFEQLIAEIDNGRPLIVSYAGHSNTGIGYDTNGQMVKLNSNLGNDPRWVAWSLIRSYTGNSSVGFITIRPSSSIVDDYNGDGKPDLYTIDKEGDGTNSTELHILSGADGYQSWLLHTGTPLHKTGLTNEWAFGLADYNGDRKPDLYTVDKEGDGTNSTELHILSGADGYQSWLLHTGTPLHKTGLTGEWVFGIADYNGDGKPDLYTIDKEGDGTNSTEVHILNGADGYQSWLLHTGTPQHKTGLTNEWAFALADYNGDGKSDLYTIDKEGDGTNSTEVHILNGADGYQSWLLHTGTPQHKTGLNCEWDFATGGDCIADTIPPTGNITSPADGSVTHNPNFTIIADVSDNAGGSGIQHVVFFAYYDGGTPHGICDDLTPPYVCNWSASEVADQDITFAIHVEDNAGNVAYNPGGSRTVTLQRIRIYLPIICRNL